MKALRQGLPLSASAGRPIAGARGPGRLNVPRTLPVVRAPSRREQALHLEGGAERGQPVRGDSRGVTARGQQGQVRPGMQMAAAALSGAEVTLVLSGAV